MPPYSLPVFPRYVVFRNNHIEDRVTVLPFNKYQICPSNPCGPQFGAAKHSFYKAPIYISKTPRDKKSET